VELLYGNKGESQGN
jgi:AAA15 family ATPase/GTPase